MHKSIWPLTVAIAFVIRSQILCFKFKWRIITKAKFSVSNFHFNLKSAKYKIRNYIFKLIYIQLKNVTKICQIYVTNILYNHIYQKMLGDLYLSEFLCYLSIFKDIRFAYFAKTMHTLCILLSNCVHIYADISIESICI